MVVILGIIAGIAVVSVNEVIAKSKREVCNTNVLNLERNYETHLALSSIEQTDVLFTQYVMEYGREICPENGEIHYVDGAVICDLHSINEDPKEDVPYL